MLQLLSTTRGTQTIFPTKAIKVILSRSRHLITTQLNLMTKDGKFQSQDKSRASQLMWPSQFFRHLTRTIEFVWVSISQLLLRPEKIINKSTKHIKGPSSWIAGRRLRPKADNSSARWRHRTVLNTETSRDQAPEAITAPSEGEIRSQMKDQSKIRTRCSHRRACLISTGQELNRIWHIQKLTTIQNQCSQCSWIRI